MNFLFFLVLSTSFSNNYDFTLEVPNNGAEILRDILIKKKRIPIEGFVSLTEHHNIKLEFNLVGKHKPENRVLSAKDAQGIVNSVRTSWVNDFLKDVNALIKNSSEKGGYTSDLIIPKNFNPEEQDMILETLKKRGYEVTVVKNPLVDNVYVLSW